MRIAADIGLPAEQLRDLFYTELLMDWARASRMPCASRSTARHS
jgi:hypothetical protein